MAGKRRLAKVSRRNRTGCHLRPRCLPNRGGRRFPELSSLLNDRRRRHFLLMADQRGSAEVHGASSILQHANSRHFVRPSLLLPHQPEAVCNNHSLIGFEVYPMDVNSGDSVAITGFNVSQANVFGGAGYPPQQTPSYWRRASIPQ
jgi:hypothetical protein